MNDRPSTCLPHVSQLLLGVLVRITLGVGAEDLNLPTHISALNSVQLPGKSHNFPSALVPHSLPFARRGPASALALLRL